MKFLSIIFLVLFSCNENKETLKISDENLAIQIAENKFTEIYGEVLVFKEQPFKATKINDSIWFVEGTFNSTGEGGVAFGKIDVKNKKVIEYSHGE